MDQGKEYPMPSGATLFVSVSSYEKVMELHDAIGAEVRGGGVGALDLAEVQKAFFAVQKKRMSAAAGVPYEDDGAGDNGLNVIVDRVLALAASKPVKRALFACAEKAVYRPDGTEATGVQFSPDLAGYGVFDNPKCLAQARADYYDICKAIAEENLRPFGKALISMFMGLMEISADSPASNTAKA